MNMQRTNVILISVALAVCVWVSASNARIPLRHRVARAARSLLWLAWAAEDPPVETRQPIRDTVGEDGYVAVDHGKGW